MKAHLIMVGEREQLEQFDNKEQLMDISNWAPQHVVWAQILMVVNIR